MKKIFFFPGLIFISLSLFSQQKETLTDTLYKNFLSPGNAARPRVWWHWMKGNITKDGIRKDLLWMHRSGIGGFQNFDAAIMTPQIVKRPLDYMTPGWKDAFLFTTKLADSLSLEMAIAGSPGWSESGGPWVPAKDGMKKIVWSETSVKRGQPFTDTLPKPPATTGAFQNLPYEENLGSTAAAPPQYYEDISVVAYRVPATDIPLTELNPRVNSSGGDFTLTQLTDGDLAKTILLPADTVQGFAWIQFSFSNPQTIKAVTIVSDRKRSIFGIVDPSEDRGFEASDDGVNFSHIMFIPLGRFAPQTVTIPVTTAKYFRIKFKNPPAPTGFGAIMRGQTKPPAGTHVAEIILHTATRIDHFEEKAGFAAAYDLLENPTPATNDTIAETDVIDLTARMNVDGVVNWTPPATGGTWKIIRFGYSLTGKQNHPASPEATGLEVDKLDASAVKDYFENYLDQYKDATGGLMGAKGLQYLVTDSYEAGQATWTPKMAEEFQNRRGYSLYPWMPVLTGVIIKSADESEKFLWDFRKTVAELITENHYDQLTVILARYGMKRYTESQENGRVFIADGMDVKRSAAIPMSAMWTAGGSSSSMAQADIRESASVAHIYGQNLVAAEALTASGWNGTAWSYYPGNLKPTADLALASGLNRFVIHTSVHQPLDDKIPGVSLGPFGQWFTRHETWAANAKTWTDYLARSSYMLQQGKFVADVAYYYGEDNNITGLFGRRLPDIPEGYSYDFINADALVNLLTVENGQLATPSGMRYRLLVLDSNARKMSLPVLRKISSLVRSGAIISGAIPEMPAGRQDGEFEFRRLVKEIWGGEPGSSTPTGKVYTEMNIREVLNDLKIKPDFQYARTADSLKLLFVHRKLEDGDIYWVNNRNNSNQNVEVTFRISGKTPQIWHPETGKTEPASYIIENDGTKVWLNLTPDDAVFVVFKIPATKTSLTLPVKEQKEIMTIGGSWSVAFQPNRGAPPKAKFDKLNSYTENGDPGIKYFSGTATYSKTVNVPPGSISKGKKTFIDLGDVKNLADVNVNGKSLGIIWKQPFRVDVSNALKPGENKLVIKVTNLWVNRLIGDMQPGMTQKITFTSFPLYRADSKLQPSGLLGPVKIISEMEQ